MAVATCRESDVYIHWLHVEEVIREQMSRLARHMQRGHPFMAKVIYSSRLGYFKPYGYGLRRGLKKHLAV